MIRITSRSTSPSPERSSWRWVPSPQSTSQRSPPRATRVAAVPRAAVGTDAAVPMNVTNRSIGAIRQLRFRERRPSRTRPSGGSSRRESSRSSSRSMRCITSLEMVPWSRRATSTRRWAVIASRDGALVALRLVLDAVLVLDLPRLRGEAALAVAVLAAHPLEGLGPHPRLPLQLVDPVERGGGDLDARLQLLAALLLPVVVDAEHADEPRQREPLEHERGEDDAERHPEDQVAAGERVAGVGGDGHGEGGRQGHGAAHAGPRADGAGLPRRAAQQLVGAAVEARG